MAASRTGRRKTASRRKLSGGSLEQYRCVYKLLQEYEAALPRPLRLQLLKRQTLPLLKKERRYWSAFFKGFCHFLYKTKGCLDGYVASVCKVLRTFFNYLAKELHLPIGTFHLQFRVPMHLPPPIVLEPFQLRFLISDAPFEASLPPHLKRTKDLFVFGCTVGLRYTDLMQLRKAHLLPSAQGPLLQVYTQKTGSVVKLPLPPYLLPILSRYKRQAGKYLLPRLSNTNLNLQLKQLMEKAGWTYALPRIRSKEGKLVELKRNGASFRFCDQVSAHTMRRTAITTLLMMGVPEQVVRRLSGHAPGSKEFYRYIALAEDYMHNHVRNAYVQLMEPLGQDAVKTTLLK